MSDLSVNPVNTLEIVSGGQTGVDQGALSAALDAHNRCGGWCPAGRRSEDGPIPARYPVKELEGSDYKARTRQNVTDSDGTAIIYFETLEGGTALTVTYCREERKPFVLIDTASLSVDRAVADLQTFVREHDIRVLNVAGPRRSKWSNAYDEAYGLVAALLRQ
ncbi:MAG: putative molybdenum carrier protein [Gammaproteobacteria bacterium]